MDSRNPGKKFYNTIDDREGVRGLTILGASEINLASFLFRFVSMQDLSHRDVLPRRSVMKIIQYGKLTTSCVTYQMR